MDKLAHEVRISVRGLERGMWVSRLDRPWLDSPFPIEGLSLRTDDDIEMLRRICSYVYVDTQRGIAPDMRFLEFSDNPLVRNAKGQEELDALRKTTWTISSDFQTEVKRAGQAHASLQNGIAEVMDDLKQGRHLDLQKLKDGVEAMVDSITRNPSAFTWLMEIKRRDNYHYQHALSCAIWAAAFGRHLGLERDELRNLALGGLLCDVGKTQMPVELLAKATPLTQEEAHLVRQHVEHSLKIIGKSKGLSASIIEMVATHHERHDGSGYPLGLKGLEIPIFGRLMGLVDSYDAMTCVRPYANSRSPHRAVAELYEHRGTLFQPELVEQFIQTCGIYPTGTLVELSSGEIGVVTAVHSLKRLRPTVMLLLDENKKPFEQFVTLDLTETSLDKRGEPLAVKSGLPTGSYGIDTHELFLD
jgi:HD-GYP domain-containing protein (c-di-GMP phosphodiesterase class II)